MTNNWDYVKLENGHTVVCPMNDTDGSITGGVVLNLKAWLDENPSERIRLGWTKLIHHSPEEVDYNPQTQYLITNYREIDEYTIEEVHNVLDKSEEQMLLEEIYPKGSSLLDALNMLAM